MVSFKQNASRTGNRRVRVAPKRCAKVKGRRFGQKFRHIFLSENVMCDLVFAHISDLGVRHAAAGVRPSLDSMRANPGPLFEQWVGLELWRRLQYLGTGSLHYLRTYAGAEVDYIVKHEGELTPIEVKWTDKPALGDARHLLTFLDANRKKSRRAFIICRCRRPMQLHDRVTVIPWHCLCEGRIGDRRPTSTHAGAVEALPPEAVSGSDSSLGPRTTPNQSCHPTKSLLRRVGNDLTAPQTFGDTVDQRMSGGLLMPTMSKTIVEIRDAEAHFAKLTPLIRAGNVITLCDDNRPLAEIHPLPRPSTARRPFGLGRGTFTVPVDFAKGDQDIERMFCSLAAGKSHPHSNKTSPIRSMISFSATPVPGKS